NNRLRILLRTQIAEKKLTSKDPDIRLESVKQLMEKMDGDAETKIRAALNKEKNKKVIEYMQLALALVDVQKEDRQTKLAALELLGESLESRARGAIVSVIEEQKQSDSPDPEILKIAEAGLKKIDGSYKIYSFIETTFFGLSLGSVLLLIAVGLAITFGVMGVINMAHGELMMLGAYTTYVVQQAFPSLIDYSVFIAIPLAFIVSGLIGILIERSVIRHLYGRPLETLLATFGISLVLQQLVRTIFSPLNRSVETPSWMSGSLEINAALSLTYNRLFIVLFALLVFIGLLLILKKTSLGLQVRAVSQDRNMARAMGIRTDWVDALTFGLGSGIAGIAGVALSQLTNVGPNLGQGYIVDSFMVVVFGGVGNLWGTLVGALTLGVGNKFLEPWTGAVLAKILILVFIILFIQKRPRGLFPQKGRAAEN
ncbi:MAG: urea ABC transporter permease subunit UrtB, partial [Gammaproteobacteria bacterium]